MRVYTGSEEVSENDFSEQLKGEIVKNYYFNSKENQHIFIFECGLELVLNLGK